MSAAAFRIGCDLSIYIQPLSHPLSWSGVPHSLATPAFSSLLHLSDRSMATLTPGDSKAGTTTGLSGPISNFSHTHTHAPSLKKGPKVMAKITNIYFLSLCIRRNLPHFEKQGERPQSCDNSCPWLSSADPRSSSNSFAVGERTAIYQDFSKFMALRRQIAFFSSSCSSSTQLNLRLQLSADALCSLFTA